MSPSDVLLCLEQKRQDQSMFQNRVHVRSSCAESNNVNIDELFNIFDSRSLGIHPYFLSNGPLSIGLLLTGCYWLK